MPSADESPVTTTIPCRPTPLRSFRYQGGRHLHQGRLAAVDGTRPTRALNKLAEEDHSPARLQTPRTQHLPCRREHSFTINSRVLAQLQKMGLRRALPTSSRDYTCPSDARPKRIAMALRDRSGEGSLPRVLLHISQRYPFSGIQSQFASHLDMSVARPATLPRFNPGLKLRSCPHQS